MAVEACQSARNPVREPGRGGGGSAAGAAPPVIAFRDVEKRYGENEVLRGVSFDVYQGEVFCLLGPNGAGKTTTLEILEGFRKATSGSACVLGFDPAGQPEQFRARIGVVLQECGFPRHARVGELIDIWRSYYRDPLPLHELLELVELGSEKATLVRRLSGGQRRRLDFALALAGDPDVIFLDEPTTGFDPEARRRCWSAVDSLRSLGKTIVLTTHYLDEAQQLADRVAILAAGRVRALGTPPALAARSGAPTRISFLAPSALSRGEIRLPCGLNATITNSRAMMHVDDAPTALRRLLSWDERHHLGGLGLLVVKPPTLEDAYLHFLGTDETAVAL
jgi:ABC-type multidrug transport system ATPase subunit